MRTVSRGRLHEGASGSGQVTAGSAQAASAGKLLSGVFCEAGNESWGLRTVGNPCVLICLPTARCTQKAHSIKNNYTF